MFARVSMLSIREDRLEVVLHALQNQGFAALQALDGCGDISIYVRRDDNAIMFVSLWDTSEQAQALSVAKYRLQLLDRVEPDLTSPVEAAVYEVFDRR
jgi:hypothetical protein